MVHCSPADLEDFCRDVFVRCGLSAGDAAIMAESLVEAERSGVGPHGMPHLLLNVQKLRDGEAVARPEVAIEMLGPSLARVDGGRCLGQIAAAHSTRLATEAAEKTGIGFCVATNTHTFGFAANLVRPLAERGFFAATWCNTSPLMAPWGGSTPLLGTNPIAMAIPTGSEPIILLDMACSVRSWADIVEAARGNAPIPEGWAVDKDGQPTTDPKRALEGALLPFGAYKGYGLALIVEIMTGYLAGHAATEPIPQADGFRRTPLRSHCMMVLDIGRFVAPETFGRNVDDLIDQIRRSRSLDGTPLRVPGAGAAARRAHVATEGIRLDPALLPELKALADELGLAFPAAKGRGA